MLSPNPILRNPLGANPFYALYIQQDNTRPQQGPLFTMAAPPGPVQDKGKQVQRKKQPRKDSTLDGRVFEAGQPSFATCTPSVMLKTVPSHPPSQQLGHPHDVRLEASTKSTGLGLDSSGGPVSLLPSSMDVSIPLRDGLEEPRPPDPTGRSTTSVGYQGPVICEITHVKDSGMDAMVMETPHGHLG